MNPEWLQGLKVGDEVVLSLNRYGDCEIRRVDRVTPTQILVKPFRFRRASGHRVGGGAWDSTSIEPVTPELRLKVGRRRAIQFLDAVEWSKLADADLFHIEALARFAGSRK